MIGQTLSHYRVLDAVGAGGMGIVYRALDERLDRTVALKMLSEPLVLDRTAVERLIREARAVSALNHPNIVTVHEIVETESSCFIVMEFVQGRTLRTIAAEPPSSELVVKLGGQIATALAVAHAVGIIHRDIKPENIMVRADGYVKVLDFGLARLIPIKSTQLTADTISVSGALIGTARYMSPEQMRGETVGCASDVFSLGLVLYELATGRHPFVADTGIGVLHAILSEPLLRPSRLNPEIPAALEGLITQMLEKDFRLRPTAAEVEAKLAALESNSLDVGVRPVQVRLEAQGLIVGREKERAQLSAAFESAESGRGLLLCVAGEAGMGKTTIVEDFLGELSSRDHPCTIARGGCSERLAGTEAYLPILEALESLLRGEFARLVKLMAPSWYMQLSSALTGDPAISEFADWKGTSQERMKRELSALLQEVCRIRPLVLFFDDLHWADVSTIDLLAYIAAKLGSMRLLVMVTFRSSEMLLAKHPFLRIKPDLQARGVCREISLEFLRGGDIKKYLALEFPRHRFPQDFLALLQSKTEGNPLFMVHLLRYLRDSGVIAEEQGRWALARTLPDVRQALPESIRGMIQKKIDQLSDEDRRLLVAGSVQGYEFDSAIVSQALAMDAADVEDRLEVLDRIHFFVRRIEETEFPNKTLTVRYRFVHALYQNALYDSLAPTRKAILSMAVANALLAYQGERSSESASELGFLFEAARDFPRASHHFLIAAQNAARVFANREAIVLARRGLDALRTLPESSDRDEQELALLLTLASPLAVVKGYAHSEVEETLLRAQSLWRGGVPQRLSIIAGLWACYTIRANVDASRDLAEQFLTVAQTLQDPALLIESYGRLGTTLFNLGEFRSALPELEKASALYELHKHRSHQLLYAVGIDPGVFMLCEFVRSLWMLGFPDQALARGQNAIAAARKLSHPPSLGHALVFAAIHHQFRRAAEKALEGAEAAIALAQEHGLPQVWAWALPFRGWALGQLGRVNEGLSDIREGLAAHQSIGSKMSRPHYLALLAETLAKKGQVQEGLDTLAEALVDSHSTRERYYEAELYRLQGELLLMLTDPIDISASQSTDPSQAEGSFRQAVQTARSQGAKSWELRALVSLGRLHLKRGTKEEARCLLGEVCSWFSEGFDTLDAKEAKELLQQLS